MDMLVENEINTEVPAQTLRIGGLRMSPSAAKVFAALAAAQGEMPAAALDGVNDAFKSRSNPDGSRYATLASITAALRKCLPKAGIAIIQAPEVEGNRIIVTTVLAHSSGEWLSSKIGCAARDAGPQAIGAAITYLRRYGLCSLAGIVGDDDDDAEAATAGSQKAFARDQIRYKDPKPMPGEKPKAEPKSPKGKDGASADFRSAVSALRGQLDKARDRGEAVKIWTGAHELLRAMPRATLDTFVDLWRERAKCEPPALEGLDYAPAESQAAG